ncbi:terminase-like family protein [Pseudoalteromonas phage vB_PtuP_Slicky01]|nr:terminase-like family protein [Pseudoalteromonas phage vB_PtuP_Slicky01]
MELELANGDKHLIDINPLTLKEWHELNPEIIEGLKRALVDTRRATGLVPIGYHRPEGQYICNPIPEQISMILSILDRHRFQKTISIRESVDVLRSKGIDIKSHQSLVNILDRTEQVIGLLPELPKSVSDKFKTPAARLKAQINRREAAKEVKEQRAARQEKKRLEAEINKRQKKIVREAKQAMVSAKELNDMQDDDLISTIEQAKAKAKSHDFDDKLVDDSRILFKPTARQAEFLAAPEKVVLYGGAAGGGKSYALIFDAVRFAHRPAMRSLIIRRRNSELKELISVTKQMYPKAFPGASFNETKMIWTFPSGATLEFGFMDKPDDKERYIGLPYSYIGWDEIQLQRSPEAFDFLFTRLRTTDPEITCYVRCTGNPGGAPWVKQRFIDPAPYNTPFMRNGLVHKFIPATMFDNPYLAEDGEYEKILRSRSAVQIRQLLYGDWDVMEDSFFNFDANVHVTQVMPPLHWPVITSMDYGWNDPATCLWAAVDPATGSFHVYRELEMIQKTVLEWGQEIQRLEAPEYFTPITDRVVDWSMFKNTGHTGPSNLETLSKLGFRLRPADRNREAGWEQVNQRLLAGIDGTPTLYVHSSCTKLIDQLKTAQAKENNPDDIDDTRMFSVGRRHHWDLLDTLRYLCMARPRTITTDFLMTNVKKTKSWEKYNGFFS